MIELKNISKIFNRNSANEVVALQNVSLVIPEKSFVVIVGANGSGKSTLLNALAGTIKTDEGQIMIGGNDITELSDFDRSKWIARIFQNPLSGTSPELTILENFRLAALRTEKKTFHIGTGEKFRKLVQNKLKLLGLGLGDKLNQPMGTLSGGQRQALTLLMAVMPFEMGRDGTKILLMDEPTAALDPKTSALILDLADKIISQYNLTVIFVTHQLKDALNYGNRIVSMERGKITRDLAGEFKKNLTNNEVFSWFQ